MKPSFFSKKLFLIIGALLIAGFLILSCKQSGNSDTFKRTEKEKLTYFLTVADSVRQLANVPGVGIAIVYNENILYTGGLGYSNVKEQIPVTENTLFSIGSNTKAFTGTLAAKLVEEGKMSWNTPLKTYIPELQLKEEYVTRNVNLRDALNHLTGLGRHDYIWKYKEFPRSEILEKIQTLDFASGLRQSFGYNNLMYAVAGIAMERASKSTYKDLVQEKLLTPLGMINSYVTQEAFESAPNRAIGYKEDGETPETIVYLNHIAPAGSISSTSKDISRWIKMLVNNGKLESKEILSESEYEFMMTGHDNIGFRKPNQFWFYNAGIGGYIEDGKRNLGHSGSIDGQNSFMALNPDDGFAIFIMTNKLSSFKELITKYAQNIFIHDNYERDYQAESELKELVAFTNFKKELIKSRIAKAESIYQNLNSEKLEGAMNQLGYELMGNGELEKAHFIFKQNTLDHPNSANVFDSMGEYYFNVENYDNSLKNYQKSFQLDKTNSNAQMMVEKINKLILK